AGGGAALVAYRTDVAEKVLLSRLAAAGVPAAKLKVAEVGLGGARITGISLGAEGEFRADALILAYDLSGLMDGRIGAVTIVRPAITADLTGGRPLLGSLQPLLTGKGTAGEGVPLPPITVTGGRIEAASPMGPLTLTFEGEAWPEEGGRMSATFSVGLDGPFGKITGLLGASARDRRIVTAKLVIDDGSLELPGAVLGGLTGELDFTLRDGLPDSLRGSLAFSDVALQQARFESARLTIEATDKRFTAEAELSTPDRALVVTMRAAVDNYLTAPEIDLDFGARVTAGAAIWEMLALPRPAAGLATLSLSAKGRVPGRAGLPSGPGEFVKWLLRGEFDGGIKLDLARVRYPGGMRDLSGRFEFDAAVKGGVLSLRLPTDGRLRIKRLAPKLLKAAGVPAVLHRVLGRDLTLVLPASTDKPFSLRLKPTAGGAEIKIQASAYATVKTGARAGITVAGDLTLDEDMAIVKANIGRITLALTGLAVAGQRITQARMTGAAFIRPGELRARGDVRVKVGLAVAGEMRAGKLSARLPIGIHMADGKTEVRLIGVGAVSAETLGYGGSMRLAKPLRVKVTDASLVLGPGDGGAITLSHRLVLLPEALEARLGGNGAKMFTLSADQATIRFDGTTAPKGRYRARVTIDGARVALPDHDILLEGLTAMVALGPGGKLTEARFALGTLSHLARPAMFAPLGLKGRIALADGALVMNAEGSTANGKGSFVARAKHRLDDGRGEALVVFSDLDFAENGLQPGDLSPALAALRSVTGKAKAQARFAWTEKDLNGTAVVELIDLAFTTDRVSVEGLNTRAVFDSLFPPSTPAGQKLTLRRVDPAIALDDVVLSYRVMPGDPPRLVIQRASSGFAGGEIAIAGFVFDPAGSSQDMELRIERLDLARLFAMVKVEGLTGSGRISGVIPLTITGDSLVIRDGRLDAAGPGVLRFRSEATEAALKGSGKPMGLLLRALQNFRYDSLSLTVKKPAKGDPEIMLRLAGRNPDVLDGHPFAFNIGLTGNLDAIGDAIRKGQSLKGALFRKLLR
ncbi:MAG: YdbH domain-containing protein, partial [Proteobacteria bacterium]|nr:YdbH domain-containing protein [Pseudomonadota bacterium]